jgi:hypothetical protein
MLAAAGGRTTVVTDKQRVASWLHDSSIQQKFTARVHVTGTGEWYNVFFRPKEAVGTIRPKLMEMYGVQPAILAGALTLEGRQLDDAQTFAQAAIEDSAQLELFSSGQHGAPRDRRDHTDSFAQKIAALKAIPGRGKKLAARVAAWAALQWVADEYPLRQFGELTTADPVVSLCTRAAGTVFLTRSGRSFYCGCGPSTAVASAGTSGAKLAAPSDEAVRQAIATLQAELSDVFKKYDVSVRDAFDRFAEHSVDSDGASASVRTGSASADRISLDAFLGGLQELNICLERSTVKACFNAVDADKDGHITYRDFKKHFSPGHKARKPAGPPKSEAEQFVHAVKMSGGTAEDEDKQLQDAIKTSLQGKSEPAVIVSAEPAVVRELSGPAGAFERP